MFCFYKNINCNYRYRKNKYCISDLTTSTFNATNFILAKADLLSVTFDKLLFVTYYVYFSNIESSVFFFRFTQLASNNVETIVISIYSTTMHILKPNKPTFTYN